DDRAGGDDGVIEGDLLALIVAVDDGDLLVGDELAATVDLLDLVLLHQVVNTLNDGRRDLAGALVRCTEVHGDVIAGNSERLRYLGDGVRQLRVTDQSRSEEHTSELQS